MHGTDAVLYETRFQVAVGRESEFNDWIRSRMKVVQSSGRALGGEVVIAKLWKELVGSDLGARFVTYRVQYLFSNLETLDRFIESFQDGLRQESELRFGISVQIQRWVASCEYDLSLAQHQDSHGVFY